MLIVIKASFTFDLEIAFLVIHWRISNKNGLMMRQWPSIRES